MSISPLSEKKMHTRLTVSLRAATYLIFGLFCLVFSVVYEYFSHGVMSLYMIGMPLFPLFLGFVPFLLLDGRGNRRRHLLWPCQLWHAAVITLTLGSALKGVMEIFGSEEFRFANVYRVAALLLAVSALIMFLVCSLRHKKA